MARLARSLGVVTSLALAGLLLASCGSATGVADVRHACVDVTRALAIEKQSESPAITHARAKELQADALARLLKATPYAAAATSQNGSWNPLMTTINEAERVPMANLVDSLTRLCKVADSSTPYLGALR